MAALVKWTSSTGDGTGAQPWKVLFIADALAYLDAIGQPTHGATLRLLGRQPRLDVLVASPAGTTLPFAERNFEVLEPMIALLERPDAARAVLPRFIEYLVFAGYLTGHGSYRDDPAALVAHARLLHGFGAANSEQGEDALAHLAQLPDRARNHAARVTEAMLRLARADSNDAVKLEAMSELTQLAELGVPQAIVGLDSAIANGNPSSLAAANVRALLEHAAAAGDTRLQHALGVRLLREGAFEEGERWLARSADGGSLVALGLLGWSRAQRDNLDAALFTRIRDASTSGEPQIIALTAIAGLSGRFGQPAPERGRRALLLLAADATVVDLVNTIAYALALGDALTGANAALAVDMLDALFAAVPTAREAFAIVDSRGVALAAAGRHEEAVAERSRGLALAEAQRDARAGTLIRRHLERVQGKEPITAATDASDARSYRE